MTAHTRRTIHLLIAVVWLGPGAVLSWLLAHSLAWIVLMSWFACVYSAFAAWAAETPVEMEDTDDA